MCEFCAVIRTDRDCGMPVPAPLAGRVASSGFEIPGDTTSTETIGVGEVRTDTLETVGDEDWFRLSLTAGQSVTIELTGSGASPLSDPYLWLYDSAGTVVAFDDDGGPGLGSLIEFTAPAAGTWFVAADSYGGQYAGEYRLAVAPVVPLTDPIPGSTATQETIALGGTESSRIDYLGDTDWFRLSLADGQAALLQVQGTGADPLYDPIIRVYGPDGQLLEDFDDGEGSSSSHRFVAPAPGTYFVEVASYAGRTVGDYVLKATETDPPRLVDSVRGFTKLDTSDPVLVYFSQAGDTYTLNGTTYTATGFNAYEANQLWSVLAGIESFAAIDFQRTTNRAAADIEWGSTDLGASLLGFFMFPNSAGAGGFGLLNDASAAWSDGPGGGLDAGGMMYGVAIHELGHALGLGHTHDSGNGTVVMNGVGTTTDLGDFELNQTVFTAMSYNDGWRSNPEGRPGTYNYGYSSTFGAIDIAALQETYGANTTARRGDNVYTLPGANGTGVGYSVIWDTAGTDEIRYGGSSDAVIDLRSATLEYELGGGGFISRVGSVFGGFSIAAGVLIENARGGGGDDLLRGNAGTNTLVGGAGADTLSGGGGADLLIGGTGNDLLAGGGGADVFRFSGSGGEDRITDFRAGSDLIDLEETGATYGELAIADGTDGAVISYSAPTENASNRIELLGVDSALLSAEDFLTAAGPLVGTEEADVLVGTVGDDDLRGLAGNDILDGRGGADRLDGGAGIDVASYANATAGVTVDLAAGGTAGEAAGDGYVDVENVLGSPGADRIIGDDKANRLLGGAGGDMLRGAAGDDILVGGDGEDWLHGGGGADQLYGQRGDDRLIAGAGPSDRFQSARGGPGDDTYVVSPGTGNLVIDWKAETAGSGSADRVVIGGMTLSDMTVRFHDAGGDLPMLRLLPSEGGGGEFRIARLGEHIESFEFADGRTFGAMLAAPAAGGTLAGTAGDDALFGRSGIDQLYARDGDDWLDVGLGAGDRFQSARGGPGDDTYVFSRDSGNLLIDWKAETAGSGAADELLFPDLELSELTARFRDIGGDLPLLRMLPRDGTGGELRLQRLGEHIESFEFADGRTFGAILAAPAAGGTLAGTAGDDALFGRAGIDQLYARDGDDWLDVGLGPASQFQSARGGPGDDTYVFSRDSGNLLIDWKAETEASGTDTILFKDLELSDFTLDRDSAVADEPGALRFLWDAGGRELRVAQGGEDIEFFEFADGTVMTRGEIVPLFPDDPLAG